MSPRYPSTDPRLIREVLAYANTHSKNATSIQFSINHHSIQRWMDYRAERHPAWPTDGDVAAWDAGAEQRAKIRRWKHRYEFRRHLNGGQPLMVSEVGTLRRLQALCAIGWTQREIGAHMGVTRSRVSNIIRNTRQNVTRETAQRVAEVYDELSMTVRVGREAARIRRYAASKGWVPPLAWDDETIDDPDARPVGLIPRYESAGYDESRVQRRIDGDRSVRLHRGETVEVVRRMLADGHTQSAIRRLTGLKPERYMAQVRATQELEEVA